MLGKPLPSILFTFFRDMASAVSAANSPKIQTHAPLLGSLTLVPGLCCTKAKWGHKGH